MKRCRYAGNSCAPYTVDRRISRSGASKRHATMRRKRLRGILSEQEQGLSKVWAWHQFQRTLIGEEKSRVLNAIRAGQHLSASRYVGIKPEELDRQFADQVVELNQVSMLGMRLRVDAPE